MMTILKVAFAIWGLWAVLVIAGSFLATRFFTNSPAVATGVLWSKAIYLHPDSALIFEAHELQMIMAHEEGHHYHNHILENMLVMIFCPPAAFFRERRLMEQEIEADDYAAATDGTAAGYQSLSSAISKVAVSDFDHIRADRCARLAMRHR